MRYSSARPRSVSASSTVRLWPTNAASASASSPVMTMGTLPSPAALVEPSAPTHVIGRNTREAMRSGVVLGEVARIDGMLDMVLAEMRATKAAGEGSVPIVITGDDAEALAALVGHSLTVDDALTLRGLAELYHINQKPRRA